MSTNIFTDKTIKPDDKKLLEALGKLYNLKEELFKSIGKEYNPVVEEWKYYGQKIGWTLKLFYKKRNLFFLTAYEKYFLVSFVFGDKAISVIEKSNLPEKIISELQSAKKYAEGRGLRIEVKNKNDIKNILKLVDIKINN
ncbi:MAG TPA: DUF3788 family protein [Ignavibacteriaceae bacterium]|nr:DUF3788 family protein [Ignavibacteriaceae bacterium]